MSRKIDFLDIFGEPIKRTFEARKKEYSRLVAQMQSLGLIAHPEYLGTFSYLTSSGYISTRVASYFLAGRVTFLQENVLKSFLEFLDSCNSCDSSTLATKSLNYLAVWREKEENLAAVNTFLFPLAELASSDGLFGIDFQKERLSYELQ